MQTFGNALSQKRNPNSVEPIEKPGFDLLEKDQVRTKRPSMWNVVFYNDDYTPMEFVEFVLKRGISYIDARRSGLDLGRPYEGQRRSGHLYV